MAYTIVVEAAYSSDADRVFQNALNVSEMRDAMRGLAVYHGLPDRDLQQGETLCVDVTFLGLFTTRNHVMYVERIDHANRVVQSREHNRAFKRWDHTLSIQPASNGCLWRDTVVLDAGWKTAFVSLFCRFVYSRRHRMRNAENIRSLIVRGDVG